MLPTDWKRVWFWGAVAEVAAFLVFGGIGYVSIALNDFTSFPPYVGFIQAVPFSLFVFVFTLAVGTRVFKKD